MALLLDLMLFVIDKQHKCKTLNDYKHNLFDKHWEHYITKLNINQQPQIPELQISFTSIYRFCQFIMKMKQNQRFMTKYTNNVQQLYRTKIIMSQQSLDDNRHFIRCVIDTAYVLEYKSRANQIRQFVAFTLQHPFFNRYDHDQQIITDDPLILEYVIGITEKSNMNAITSKPEQNANYYLITLNILCIIINYDIQ